MLVSFAFPGYHAGLSIPHVCLHSPSTKDSPSGIDRTAVLFKSITALRLHAPIYIEISGQIEIGERKSIKTATLYDAWSPWWQPDNQAYYSGRDVRAAGEIATRLLEVSQSGLIPGDAVILFSQVTCGYSVSWQMCYLALFSVLEFLFGPLKGNKAATLANRVEKFLSHFDFPRPLGKWLEGEYIHGRSKFIHAQQDLVTPWREKEGTRSEAFGGLHEIARLAILGYLSFDDDKLQLLSKSRGNELDNLGPATGRFLEGQRFWL